jgi:hypothetical protein
MNENGIIKKLKLLYTNMVALNFCREELEDINTDVK